MRTNLSGDLALAFIDTSQGRFAGLAEYFQTTVPGLLAAVEDEALQAEFSAANAQAIEAINQTIKWLEAKRDAAHDGFALGEERFLQMLRASEGIEITIAVDG